MTRRFVVALAPWAAVLFFLLALAWAVGTAPGLVVR